MDWIGWAVTLGLVAVVGYLATRFQREDTDAPGTDAGLALLEFGRAFPNEAVRSLHVTADGKAVFVRLHDNKAGFMRNMGNHYACHLIEPGRVRVRPIDKAAGFAVDFLDAPYHNGNFTFPTAAEAAEVSLWLLGNYVGAADQTKAEAPARHL